MKFLTCSKDGVETFGAVTDAGVVDLGKRHPELPDLREAIRQGKLLSLIHISEPTRPFTLSRMPSSA